MAFTYDEEQPQEQSRFTYDDALADVQQQPAMPPMDPQGARNAAQMQVFSKNVAAGMPVTMDEQGNTVSQEAPWYRQLASGLTDAANVATLGIPAAITKSMGYDPTAHREGVNPLVQPVGETAGAFMPSGLLGKAKGVKDVIMGGAGLGATYGATDVIARKGFEAPGEIATGAAIGGAIGAAIPGSIAGASAIRQKFAADAASLALRAMKYPNAKGPQIKERARSALLSIAEHSEQNPTNAAETIAKSQDAIDALLARKDAAGKGIPKVDLAPIAEKLDIKAASEYGAPEAKAFRDAYNNLSAQVKEQPIRTFSELERAISLSNKKAAAASWNGVHWSPSTTPEAEANKMWGNELRALQRKLLEESGEDADINRKISSLIDFKNGVTLKMMNDAKLKNVGMLEAAAIAHGIAGTLAGDAVSGSIALGMQISKHMNKQDPLLRRAFNKIRPEANTAMQQAAAKAAAANEAAVAAGQPQVSIGPIVPVKLPSDMATVEKLDAKAAAKRMGMVGEWSKGATATDPEIASVAHTLPLPKIPVGKVLFPGGEYPGAADDFIKDAARVVAFYNVPMKAEKFMDAVKKEIDVHPDLQRMAPMDAWTRATRYALDELRDKGKIQ